MSKLEEKYPYSEDKLNTWSMDFLKKICRMEEGFSFISFFLVCFTQKCTDFTNKDIQVDNSEFQ